MTRYEEAVALAESQGIEVFITDTATASVCDNGVRAIFLKPDKTMTLEEKYIELYHEFGHCSMRAFYDAGAPKWVINKCERRAYEWAIRKLVPFVDLKEMLDDEDVTVYDMAERFSVTPNFICLTVQVYRQKGYGI